jgi:hypothetical protein
MNRIITGASLLSLLFVCSCRNSAVSTVWDIDNLKSIGGHKTTVLGSPKVTETDKGKAVEFDGVKDGLLVEALPLTGAGKFTLEIIFRPDAKGLKEQRFLHLQEDGTAYRILIETRLTDDDLWYLDTYIETPEGKKALLDAKNTHPVGQWYCATLVYDGQEMRHYINGVKEMSAKLAFRPLNEGKTSIGVRMNQVYWFKGAIRKVRFGREALEPKEFLQP